MRSRIIYNSNGTQSFFLDDRPVTEKEYRDAHEDRVAEVFKSGETATGLSTKGTWPLVSDALGCHPKQVQEMNERNKKHGISVQYDKTGKAHVPDVGNHRKLLKLEGMFNKDSFLS